MTFDERTKAVKSEGFTERQARFLVTVMLHSGVCMDRHYCAFARIAHGQNTTDFFGSLVQRNFATAYACAHKRARIFHIHHRRLYRAVGEPHSRFRKPTPIGQAIERLMLLDAVLGSSGTSWLATERDKLAHFSHLLRSRLEREDFPHLTFGSGARKCIRYFPDKLPIGIDRDEREHIFAYLVTRAAPVDFRAFLMRHAELFRALNKWTVRLWIPSHLADATEAYESACRQELGMPLRLSTAEELRWFFEQQRKRSVSPNGVEERRNGRYADACKAFSAPRYRVLYRAWLREGPAIIDATASTVLRDAIERGNGRIESCVLSRPYLHLSPLVGTSWPRGWETKGETRGWVCIVSPAR